MSGILKTVFSLSCSGALLIMVFFLFRPLFQKHMSKRWQYYIWLAVIARLLLPFSLEINLMETIFQRIGQGMEQIEPVSPSGRFRASLKKRDGPGTGRSQDHEEVSEKGSLSDQQPVIQVSHILWLCWLTVTLIFFIRKITVYQCFVKYIKAGCREVEDMDLLEQFGKLVEQCKVKTTVELYTNNLISSPLLIGFFRPSIVLPTKALPASEFQYIILHELTHYKRGDMFYKWLVQAAVCVHWFNPLVSFMSREMEQACELSCDEAVIKNLNEQERRVYGDTLLNAAGKGGSYKNSIASVTLGESRERLQERLDAIKGFHTKSKSVFFTTAVLTLAICFVTAAIGSYAAAPFPGSESSSQARPRKTGDLTLMEYEYTMEELKRLSVTNILINTLSDEVSVVRRGATLKIEYYARNQEEYALETQRNAFHSLQESTMSLTRFRPSEADGERSVRIVVPDRFQLGKLNISTTSGSIRLTDCTAKAINLQTQNGQIDIFGGAVSEGLSVFTMVGNVLVSGTSLPDSSGDRSCFTSFHTESGTVIFQPEDSADNYCFSIDYGEESELMINGEGIEKGCLADRGGDEPAKKGKRPEGELAAGEKAEYVRENVFTFNETATKKISFNSLRGSFLVQER